MKQDGHSDILSLLIAGFDLAFVCAFEWAVRLSSCKGGSSKGKPLEISSFSRDPQSMK